MLWLPPVSRPEGGISLGGGGGTGQPTSADPQVAPPPGGPAHDGSSLAVPLVTRADPPAGRTSGSVGWHAEDGGPGGAYSVVHDTTLSVDAGEGVLADVIGSPGATLTAALVTGPESGTLSLAADGSFTFTPAQGFVGAVAFDYEPIEDGTPLAVRTVVIPVTNARPYAYGAEFSIKHDTALSGALDGQDNDGDALTFAVTAPPAGQLALDAGTGAFTYTPPPGFVGDDTFQYVVSDGIDTSDPETVLIRVTNHLPIGAADAYAVVHDRVLNVTTSGPGVLANDLDQGGDGLAAVLATPPSYGTVELNPAGSFVYTPAAGFVGEDVFWYVVDDGAEETDPIPVAVSVVNHRPVPVSAATDFGTSGPLYAAVGRGDGDGDPLVTSLLLGPSAGDLVLNADGSYVYTPDNPAATFDGFTFAASDGVSTSDSGTAHLWLLLPVPSNGLNWGGAYTGTHDRELPLGIMAATPGGITAFGSPPPPPWTPVIVTPPAHGTLAADLASFTPDQGYTGTDWFTFYLTDGTRSTNVAPAYLTIINNAPVTRADADVTTELDPLSASVVSNDDDLDNDAVTAELLTAPDPAAGSFVLHADGTFDFTPAVGYHGIISFTYRLTDGVEWSLPATAFITVQPVTPLGELGISNGIEDGVLSLDDIREIDPKAKRLVGAVSVANLNDTDNDGVVDKDDTAITAAAGGRNELDMMLVRLKKPGLLGGRPLPNGTKLRAVVVNGPGKLWSFYSEAIPGAPPGTPPNILNRQSKRGGAAPAEYDVSVFAPGVDAILLYLEATDVSALRGITVAYQVKLPGGNWVTMDDVRATGVWVTKTQVYKDRVPAQVVNGQVVPPALPANLVNETLLNKITIDRVSALDGSLFGLGPCGKIPGTAIDSLWGGRILYEYQIAPQGSGALVWFDTTRRARGQIRYLPAGSREWVDVSSKVLPAAAEQGNDDGGDEDEQRNPDEKVGNMSANGFLYSWDVPSYGMAFFSRERGYRNAFATDRVDFSEWVRIKPKSQFDFAHEIPGLPQFADLQGSRASALTPWHISLHLKWDGAKLVPDTSVVTASGSYFDGVGTLGAMAVETVGSPPTEGFTATFNNGSWTVVTASGASKVIAGATGTVEFTDAGGNVQYRVTITQGAGGAAFVNGDTFRASVYKTGRMGGKVTELAEGPLADVTTD